MPPVPKYPGVYVQEIPSTVHRIPGVATPVAAFVGWAPKGPVNQATLVRSWQDFQTQFGALGPRSYMGNAVKQFFSNGGQQAYVVRTYGPTPPQGEAGLAAVLEKALENVPPRWRFR